MLIGYARVSTDEQHPEAQLDALRRAGVADDNLYVDHTSGAKSSRPQWDVVQRVLREGDTLVATRLDRVGRSTAHLVTTLDEFGKRGVSFQFLEQGIDTTTAEGRLVYRTLAAVAEFQRDLIVANTREGLAAARARGRKGGRKPKLSPTQVRDAQAKYDSNEWTVQQIADLYGVPRTTLYNHLATGTPTPSPAPTPHETGPATPPPDKMPSAFSEDEQQPEPTVTQAPPRATPPRRRTGKKAKTSSSRARTHYTSAELDAYQLESVYNESSEITEYRVLVAGDVLGTIERAPYGHRGWLARDTWRSAQPHRGRTGKYARNRELAVIDLLMGLGITSTRH